MKPACDVAILGSGLAGAILARNGAETVVLDKNAHPRFAIGESTIPQTSLMLKVLADRYDVPEFHNISSWSRIDSSVTKACGVKLAAGFVYHRKNRELDPFEANQSATGHEEAHYFRQDIDYYLLKVAAEYGCKIHENTEVDGIHFKTNLVRLSTNRGELTARYLVDGSGYNSVLSRMFGLRNSGERIARTHSRGVFTHMADVPHFDHVLANQVDHGCPIPWSKGTLHHLFDRGWMWVIPFDNHDSAINKLCSVGLMLDTKHHPKDDTLSPEDEFFSFVSQYPRMDEQFRNARAARAWVSLAGSRPVCESPW
jgi:FADH2 O2-dependent halogenase